MGRSLIDLFKSSEYENALNSNVQESRTPVSDSFPGSEFDVVKTDTETFLEQESSGIRVASAVDLNNPIIYGNEAVRIGNRTTPTLDTIKGGTNPSGGDGGLLGKGIKVLSGKGIQVLSGGKIKTLPELTNKLNSFLGIPQPPLPTRVANDMIDGKTAQEAIDNTQGTEFGKFLKQTGGGNPETIAKQAVGNAIELVKDKARNILFGTPLEPTFPNATDSNTGPSFGGSTKDAPHSEVEIRGYRSKDSKSPEELSEDYAAKYSVNLADYSPVYGVERGSKKVGNDKDYAQDMGSGPLQKYTSEETYSDLVEGKTMADYGFGGIGINRDEINLTKYGNDSTENLEKLDLVPFWIGRIEAPHKIHFRTTLTAINENVSPNWSSNQFFGNPYQFYTYGGVERNVSFNFLIYCMDETELSNNWQKINELTKLTYPMINDTNYVEPPIVEFRLGDIYKAKIAYIESLTYTFPDNGTWEIDPETGLLPKFIEVAISFKFIEQAGSEKEIYSIEPSINAKEARNAQKAEFSTQGITSVGNTSISAKPLDIRKKPPIALSGKPSIPPTGDTEGVETTSKAQQKNEEAQRRGTVDVSNDALQRNLNRIFNQNNTNN
jgi:hypothetical protein